MTHETRNLEAMDGAFHLHTRGRRRVRHAARALRKEPTTSEALLWEALRGRKLAGRKFRRQHPIGRFVVDFYCHEERLAVEVDGPVHRFQRAGDRERQMLLEKSGVRVVRIRAGEIERDIRGVLKRIEKEFDPHPLAPLPRAGEGRRQSG